MSTSQSPNNAHNSAVAVAESSRQAAVAAAGNNQLAVAVAEITFYRACVASALANKCGTSAYMSAIKALGGTL